MTIHFKFANCAFNPRAGLSVYGKPVHLPPKEKGMLHVLLAARGQVVRKDELVTKVWGITETSDESISRAVYRLRMATQAAGGSDVIATVYSSSFRIKVPVRVMDMDESSSLMAITQSPQPHAVAALISAREFIARRSAEDMEAAANAGRVAISADPTFSAAWSTLAEIRVFQATRSLRPPREAGWLGKAAAQAALNIDPESPAALAIRGWIRVMIDHERDGGLEDLDRSIANDPDFWVGNLLRGWAMQAA